MSTWDDAYASTPPWDIGRPQPAFVEIVNAGELNPGRVLDVGCGTGENAIFLAQHGFQVSGIDLVKQAIAFALAKATARKATVNFHVGNALSLGFENREFDNVVDSGLFHTFSDQDRSLYVREMSRVLRTKGKYFMLCFSDKEPTNWGGPRRVSRREIEDSFTRLFRINYIRDASFATRIHNEGGKAYLTSATKID